MTVGAQQAADLFRRPPADFIEVGNGLGAIAYRTIGTGPDVLFVHGWPVSGATFRCLLPYLAEHFTCHIVDLQGAGSSRYTENTPLSFDGHIAGVRAVLDWLGLPKLAVVGHDAGGLIARHAVVGDSRVRALALIDTEPNNHMSLKFRSFVMLRHAPYFGRIFGWLAGAPRVRRNRLALGDAFFDASLIDGEFDEFFLKPLHDSAAAQQAAAKLLKSYRTTLISELPSIHQRLTMPVHLVWGEKDKFFPIKWVEEMRKSFPNATAHTIANAGLFAHEERPEQVAQALLRSLI